MIFIEENCVYKKKVRYEFTYLDYLYFCDRENWKRIIKGEYPISNDEEDTICVLEEGEDYLLEANIQEKKQDRRKGNKKHDKILKDILQNKEEIVQFINKFVGYEVKTEGLEIYNRKI